MTRAVRELGEDKLLAQVFPRLNRNSRVVIGAGDDCAVVKFHGAKDWLLLKTDCVVEEVHFARETSAARCRLESNDACAERFRSHVRNSGICAYYPRDRW